MQPEAREELELTGEKSSLSSTQKQAFVVEHGPFCVSRDHAVVHLDGQGEGWEREEDPGSSGPHTRAGTGFSQGIPKQAVSQNQLNPS